ncbi:hypothetical protein SAMN06295967_10143 [Belliella buryatensis]|uniref:DUF4382 domain-containing protein n=1 Tax=Belliella buryatensis TaxID=1500549 RepID=A0A239AE16_9BACT|nr:hypothetical protein [Belliella buryatensis]SNR93284.1 hypothetical protein SAMN06295967_10143 [Belliella buryatensis]
MDKISNWITTAMLIAIATFGISCSENDDIPGQGDGKLGIAILIKNDLSNNSNARVLDNRLTIENGFIQVKELELEMEGRNDIGRFEKELEIKFKDIRKVNLDQFNPEVDFFINIPEGEYKEIELELDLIDYRNEPSIFLSGTFRKADESIIPLRFEHFGDDIDFEVEIEAKNGGYFTVDRINNPLALLEINALNWFSAVLESELENATITNGELIISNNQNRELYRKIKNRIEASSDIEIELRN